MLLAALVSVTAAPVVSRTTSAPPASNGSLSTAEITTESPTRYVPLGVDDSKRTSAGARVSIRRSFAAASEPLALGCGSVNLTAAPLDPRKSPAAALSASLAR